MVGEKHYAWKGDAARDESKRNRAQRMYPLDGVECEGDGCGAPATDRHHIDGDTGHNERSNIMFLCRRHHMEIDGRLEALAKNPGRGPLPPRPCAHCGQETQRLDNGRCHTCAVYWRRTGEDRPDWLIRGETAPPTPCSNCGQDYKPLRKGRCEACYRFWRRRGMERTSW